MVRTNFHNIDEDVTLQKMMKDKKDDPDKKIPSNFEKFVNSDEFNNLLEAMLDYCRELFRLENKQTVLEQEAKQRGLPNP